MEKKACFCLTDFSDLHHIMTHKRRFEVSQSNTYNNKEYSLQTR